MDQVHRIRELYFSQGKNLSEIAAEIGCDWRTVRKYVEMEDFSPPRPKVASDQVHESKLDPYKPTIDSWLAADTKAPRKQRHTAKRVFQRLQHETVGFNSSYRLVAEYVSRRKKELNLCHSDSYLPLIHRPGAAQADFGSANFVENGKERQGGKYLVLSFPYSNGGYLQMSHGENLECLLEELQAIFEYIGGVPTEIWFDNTKTIVTKIMKGGDRGLTERFRLFAEHYRFTPVFMNTESGNEKGNVENKVGYLRRNTLVPVPHFLKLKDWNSDVFAKCDEDMQREHYSKDESIFNLFKEDKAALLPLPGVRFDTAGYHSVRTDKYGKFSLDEGKHRYSTAPGFCLATVQIKLTSTEVFVMDADMRPIVTHRRLYGADEPESMEWIPYLKDIARKPRSLRNSGIYYMMPEKMQVFMDNCASSDRGRVLKILAELTERTGFSSALQTVDQAIRYEANDPDSLMALYNRLYSDSPELPPLDHNTAIPADNVIPLNTDFRALDNILHMGGAANG